MVVVLVAEHERVHVRELREVQSPRREHAVSEGVDLAEVLTQERVDEQRRVLGANQPALVSEEGDRQHLVQAYYPVPGLAGVGLREAPGVEPVHRL